MNKTSAIVLLAGALALSACEKSPEAPAANQGVPPASQTPETPAPVASDFKPEYTLEFVTPEGGQAPTGVQWTAQVNTGGWTMTTESVLVEPYMGDGMTVRVYVILEQPGPGETVTQAMETLTGSHDAAQPITHAELSIKRTVRGDTSPWAPMYSVVKTLQPE